LVAGLVAVESALGQVGSAAGLVGRAASFNTTSPLQYTTAPLFTSGSFSMACWIFPNNLSASYTWLMQPTAPGAIRQGIRTTATTVQFFISQTNAVIATASAVGFVAGAWNHVVGTCDGSVANLYINGRAVGRASVVPDYTGGIVMLGGIVPDGTGTVASGLLQLAGVWAKVLSLPEIAALYSGGRGLDYAVGSAA
jgi:hypothetical protein